MSEDISLRLFILRGLFFLCVRFIETDEIIDDKFLNIIKACGFEQVLFDSFTESSSYRCPLFEVDFPILFKRSF